MTPLVEPDLRVGRLLGSTWYTAMTGVLLGVVVWFATALTTDQEPPAADSTASGRVVGKLGAPCALVDETLLERLYGDGTAEAEETADPDTRAACEWSASPTSVRVVADLEDHPEGSEAGGANAGFDADLAMAEEADPVRGLPEKLTGLGDEAYVVYDPKTGGERNENAVLQVRRGNVVVTVTVRRAPKSGVVGHDRMVEETRHVAAAAVARLPQ